MTCPKCNSDDWKLASLVYKEGITHVNAESSGVGVGISASGLGAGIGKSKTSGIHQSETSKIATPPKAQTPPLSKGEIISGGIGLLILGFVFSYWFILVGLIICPIAWLLWRPEDENFVDQRMENWENSRVCQRCGEIYLS